MENIVKITYKNDINLENVVFRENSVDIFLVIKDYNSSVYFLSSVFVKKLYFTLYKKFTKLKNGT